MFWLTITTNTNIKIKKNTSNYTTTHHHHLARRHYHETLLEHPGKFLLIRQPLTISVNGILHGYSYGLLTPKIHITPV